MTFSTPKLFAVALGLSLMSGAASAATIFSDTFTRDNSHTLGNGWEESEVNGAGVLLQTNGAVLRGPGSTGPSSSAMAQAIDASGFEDITLSFRWGARIGNTDLDTLYAAWSVNPAPSITTPSDWTTLGSFSSGGLGRGSATLLLGDIADNQNISIMFWMDVANTSTPNNGFRIDNVSVEGSQIENGLTVAPVPLPAGLPLLLAGLGGMALLRRRNASKG